MKLNTQRGLVASVVVGLLLWLLLGAGQAAEPKSPAKAEANPTGDLRALTAGRDAAAAVVYDKDGKIHFVSPDGRPIEQCQLCTPELEAKFGKNCTGAGKPEHAKQLAALTPKLCRGAGSPQTSLKGLSSISAVRHSGSECYTWYVCDGGTCQTYQYCW